MNIIDFKVKEITGEIDQQGLGYENAVAIVRNKVDYLGEADQLNITQQVMHHYQKDYDEHVKVCQEEDPMHCTVSQWNIPFLHLMEQDIRNLENRIKTSKPDS